MSSPEVVAKSGASPSNTKAEGATAGEEAPSRQREASRRWVPHGEPHCCRRPPGPHHGKPCRKPPDSHHGEPRPRRRHHRCLRHRPGAAGQASQRHDEEMRRTSTRKGRKPASSTCFPQDASRSLPPAILVSVWASGIELRRRQDYMTWDSSC